MDLDIDIRQDGCGDQLFPYPVYPEVSSWSKPEKYERPPRQIAILRLGFPSDTGDPRAAGRLLGSLAIRHPVSFEAIGTPQGIVHQVVCQQDQSASLTDWLRAEYPGLAVEPIRPKAEPFYSFLEPLRHTRQRPAFAFRDYCLWAPFFLPLLSAGVTSLHEVLARVALDEGCLAMWQLLLIPARERWLVRVRNYLGTVVCREHLSATWHKVELRLHPELVEEDLAAFKQGLRAKPAGKLFAVCLRTSAFGYQDAEQRLLQGLDGCLKGFHREFDNQGFRFLGAADYEAAGVAWEDQLHMLKNRVTFSSGMVLTAAETGELLPFPPRRVLEDAAYPIARARRTRPVPAELSSDGVRIGINDHHGRSRPVMLPWGKRNRHIYVIGKTRIGKSSMILNMIVQDMAAGEGLSVFDPEGDLIDGALAHVPAARVDDVVLFDVGDPEYAVAFNALHGGDLRSPTRRRRDFLEIFERSLGETLGPRMRMILSAGLDVLLEVKESSLKDLWPLLTDATFRQGVLALVKNPDTRRFWLHEFPEQESQYSSSIVALGGRFKDIVDDEDLKAVTCQRRNLIDVPAILRERKILLVNLNFKVVGQAVGCLLGQMLMGEIQIAGMSRSESERVDHYLYADEFQNYLCDPFKELLTRGGKYRMNLCLVQQYVGQAGELVKAILGDCGVSVIFQVGPGDAQLFAVSFGGVSREELGSQPRFHAWVKSDEHIFTVIREAPPAPEHSCAEQIRELSRRRYGTRRSEINYDPPFLPGYQRALAEGEGRGAIRIDESWDKL